MALKRYNPTSDGRRHMTSLSYSEITTDKPERSLLESRSKTGGRNANGRITVRHIGGGNRAKYRIVDFKRNKDGVPAKVASIEYDPYRSAFIALLNYADGEKRYILAPVGLQVGDTVMSGEGADIKAGNALPLEKIPVGTLVHNIEMQPGKGGQIARAAGACPLFIVKEGKDATLKLPSGEKRLVVARGKAPGGEGGNLYYGSVGPGEAGRERPMGVRPTVRGVVMNPNDHPHGGGEGKSPIGMPSPVTPWGVPTLGHKTRHKNKSNKMIIKRIN